MNAFLTAIGWWNFLGSFIMVGMLNESFGKKLLNEWTQIFKENFTLNYWGKLWLFWAAGLNVFFGLVNIMSVQWEYNEIKEFLVYSDLIAYLIFFSLTIWGLKAGRLGSGVYSVFIIFAFWICWGLWVII